MKIIHRQLFDEKCNLKCEHWTIEELRSNLLGFVSWKPLKHRIDNGRGSHMMVTKFSSEDEAREVIGKILSGTPRNEWVAERGQ